MGTKIIGGFLSLSIIVLMIGSIAYFQIGSVDFLVSDQVIEKAAARNISKNIILSGYQIYNLVKEYLTVQNTNRAIAIDILIRDEARTMQEFIRQVKKRKLTYEENEKFNQIRDVFKQYLEKMNVILSQYDTSLPPASQSTHLIDEFNDLHLYFITLLLQFDRIETDLMYESWDYAKGKIHTLKSFILILSILGILLAITLGYVMTKSVTTPISKLVKVLEKYGGGDLDFRAEIKSRDEIGFFARKFNILLDQLQSTQRQLMDTIDFLPDATFVISKDKRVIAWNRAVEEMTGVKKTDILEKSDYTYSVPFYNEERPMLADLIIERDTEAEKMYPYIERRGNTIYTEVFAPAVFTGNGAHISAIASPLYDLDGNIIGAIESLRDVSEKKKLEEELFKSQKIESIGIFAGGIAHDFNNFLTGILGNTSLALHHVKPDEKIYPMLMEIVRASAQAENLTKQLLTFSRGGEPVKTTVSIVDLVKEAAGFALSGSAIKCEFEVNNEIAPIIADKGQIYQVINNIVLNARQAMPHGGKIVISFENYSHQLHHKFPLKTGNYVRISMKDEGIGISREDLLKIYDPFFTTKPKGNGLGLSTTFSIIKKHEGYIDVESVPGEGTTFHIFLPSSSQQSSEKESEKDDTTFKGEGRILLMDDDDIIQRMGREILTELGFQVDVTENGEETIRMYEDKLSQGTPYDILILDLTIPGGMGGEEVITFLIKDHPDIKAIVSSGYSNDPIMAEYQKYGFRGIITKPYKVETLIKAIKNVMRQEQ
jgi:PAS domain S-box-containing protein